MIKCKIMSVRSRMPRIGTRKLYYLLKEDFLRDGIVIGRIMKNIHTGSAIAWRLGEHVIQGMHKKDKSIDLSFLCIQLG
jgi:hypothetical protein